MHQETDEPGWQEVALGLSTFLVLLFPSALIVGYFHDRPVAQGIIGSTVGGFAGVGAFAVAYRWRIRALAPFGFRTVSSRWLAVAVGLGIVGYGLNLVIQFMYSTWVGSDDPQGALHAAARGGWLPFVASLLGGAVFTPIGEEIFFRGVVANALNRHGAWAGIGASSLIFGIVHGVSVILPVAIMVGLLSSVLFVRTGSVWPCVVLHCVYNGANSVASAIGFAPMHSH